MKRLAWVYGSKISGIGRYSDTVLKSLNKYFEIETFSSNDDFSPNDLSNFSEIVYNLGNSKDNLQVYLTLRKKPGIVILHDRTYHNLFAYYYIEYLNKNHLYYEILEQLYGIEILKYLDKTKESGIPIWETEKSLIYHFREMIYPYATSIIVHSKSYFNEISREYLGKSLYIPHPYYHHNDENIKDKRKDINSNSINSLLKIPKNKIILFSYGFLNRNRAIKEVIEIIGKNSLIREKTFFVIAGQIDDKYLDELKITIKKYSLENEIRICGFLDYENLINFLKISDLCLNLRLFNTEGASGSLLEQMYLGKAVLVISNGFFSEFPDDVLIKIKGIEELENSLMKIVKGEIPLESFAQKAENYVIKNFKLEDYVESFSRFLVDAILDRNSRKILINFSREIIDALPKFLPKNLKEKIFTELTHKFFKVVYSEGKNH